MSPSSHRTYTSGFRSWAAGRGLIGEVESFDAAASDTDKIQALLEFVAWCVSGSNQAGTIAGKPCYTSTASTYKWSCLRRRCLLSVYCKGLHCRTLPQGPRKKCVADFRGIHYCKDRAWPRLGVRAAAFFRCLSRWVIFSWRGRTKSSPRPPEWCTPCIA